MDVELITVGNELLLGFTIDTNAAYLARALASVGARVVRRTTVGDGAGEIRTAVTEALNRTGFVITTGGLGPTRDDVTKTTVAGIYGAPLELDQQYLEALRQRFESLGRPMPASNRGQAEHPRGATVLPNRWGTAPGLWLEGPPGVTVLLPGVPREMRKLAEHELIPRVADRVRRSGAAVVVRSTAIRTTGIAESALAERIAGVEDRLPPLTLAYLPSVTGVDLRLTAWNLEERAAIALLEQFTAEIRALIGPWCYGADEDDLAAVVLDALRRRGHRLAVAESCTGGMLGERITAVPGSSEVFLGGVIAYANEAKTRELGVPPLLLEEHGAVSEAVVRAMAQGVTAKFGADAGMAVTGIAGPGGGSAEKPVGTVWVAAAIGNRVTAVMRRLHGGRQEIRSRSAQAALDLLRTLINAG